MNSRLSREVIEAVALVVEARQEATFLEIAELLRLLRVPPEGPYNLSFDRDSNVVLWSGMSDEMVEVIFSLLRERKIFAHPGAVSAYHEAGGVLRLPLVADAAEGSYDSPHWLPIVFRPTPPASAIH